MDTKEKIGVGIVVLLVIALLFMHGGSAEAQTSAPATSDNTVPVINYNFAAPDFNPIPISQVNINRPQGQTIVQPGANSCGCSGGDEFVASFQGLVDDMTSGLKTSFTNYVNNILEGVSPSVKKFLNNAQGAAAYGGSQEEIAEFANTANVNIALTRHVTYGPQGYGVNTSNTNTGAKFSYSGEVTGAQFTNTF